MDNIKNLREALDKKEFTAVELAEKTLAKIEENKDLNAFITLNPEETLRQAKAADEKIKNNQASTLTGIPVPVKDVILTKNFRTTCASKILDNFMPPYDATVTSKLLAEGAVCIGKTNMDEFAMGSSNENSAYGNVLNPHDKSRAPGGSSGGSAVSVAAGLTPVALGTDTGGSIRQPAALCGVTGIRPTYGRVSRYGVIAYASSLDQVGTFGSNVTDTALLLNSISGHDPLDSTSVKISKSDFTSNLGQEIKGLKIGMPKEYFVDGLQREVEESVKAAIKKLEYLGAEIVEVSLPHTKYAVPCYYIIATAEASSNLSRYDGIRYGVRTKDAESLLDLYCNSRSEGFGLEVKRRILIGTYVLSAGYYDAYYLKAQKVRRLIKIDFEEAFKQCDLIAGPVSPTTAFKIGEKCDDPVQMYLNDIFTIPVNLAGLPGISVPCGFDNDKLPIGLHLIGKAWDEETILKTAYAYEQQSK